MELLTMLRTALHGSDHERAKQAEASVLQRERSRRAAFLKRIEDVLCRDDETLPLIGQSMETGRAIRLTLDKLLGHWSIVGPSGSGKTFFVIALLQALWQLGVPRVLFLDPKAEGVELALRLAVRHAGELPPAEREVFLDRVVWIDLFSGSALPCLQVLDDPGSDAELLAFEVASILMGDLTTGLGIRQEGIAHRLLEVLAHARLPVSVLPALIQDVSLLDALADTGVAPELAQAAAARLRSESTERLLGIQSRVESVLRLKSSRLALCGAPSSLDFGRLLDGHCTFVSLAPPGGAEDVSRVLRGLIWSKVSRAIRARPNGALPVALCIDEFPTFLAAGGGRAADSVEDGLRLARSKRAFHWLLAQDLSASISKISSSLPTVLKANAHMHAVFRAPRSEDWGDYLPVTGCQPRPPGPVWETPRPGYLDRSAERELLRERLVRAPDRTALLVDSRRGAGLFMRTATLDIDVEERAVEDLRARASRNAFVRPVAELENGLRDVEARLTALRARAPKTAPRAKGAAAPRGPRPVELG